MDFSKKNQYVLYLDKNSAFFLGQNLAQVLKIELPTDTISDLEIVNREKLSAIFSNFIKAQNIPPGELTIILAHTITFQKDFLGPSADEQEIKEFFDIVPFQEIAEKTFKVETSLRAVAGNKELIEIIRNAFFKEKFTIVAVAPITLLVLSLPQLSQNIDLNLILSHIEAAKQYTFLDSEEKPSIVQNPISSNKGITKRALVLIGVFAVLIIILAVMVVQTFFVTQPKTPVPVRSTTPVVVPAQQTASPSAKSTPSTAIPTQQTASPSSLKTQ